MTDIEIAQKVTAKHIREVAKKLTISEEKLEYYGNVKAKLPLDLIDEETAKKSNLILVTAITPTPAGEGKTTTSIGLSDGLNHIRTCFWNERWRCRWWMESSNSHGRY
jgi:formate--tetrahydrofolate ligase